jgi:cation:H+ antiporter
MEHLINFEKIANDGPLGTLLLVAILIVSIVILTKGADWLVEGAAQLAYRLGISKIIVGATVVSLGTTTPETAVSVMAAIKGESGFALGNAVGSVICDTGLIFGLGCVLTRLPMDRFILNRHGWLQFGSGCLLVLLAVGSYFIFGESIITRPMGVFLLILLAGYLFISVKWSKAHPLASEDAPEATHSVLACLGFVVVGVTLVVLSAQMLIGSAEQLGLKMGVPKSVISATLVALGTSLPELATAITSIRKGHPEILIGNIVGADILNVLFVIGTSATAVSLPVPKDFFIIHFPVMLLILLIFRIAIFTSHRKASFSRWWGLPLLLIYASYITVAYLMR